MKSPLNENIKLKQIEANAASSTHVLFDMWYWPHNEEYDLIVQERDV